MLHTNWWMNMTKYELDSFHFYGLICKTPGRLVQHRIYSGFRYWTRSPSKRSSPALHLPRQPRCPACPVQAVGARWGCSGRRAEGSAGTFGWPPAAWRWPPRKRGFAGWRRSAAPAGPLRRWYPGSAEGGRGSASAPRTTYHLRREQREQIKTCSDEALTCPFEHQPCLPCAGLLLSQISSLTSASSTTSLQNWNTTEADQSLEAASQTTAAHHVDESHCQTLRPLHPGHVDFTKDCFQPLVKTRSFCFPQCNLTAVRYFCLRLYAAASLEHKRGQSCH